MRRTWTIIGVADVARSLAWYQTLLGLPKSAPAHDYFGQILDADGTVLLCLHQWGTHGHPPLTRPDPPPGNGLLLFFRVDDFDEALPRARALVSWLEEEPHRNPSTSTMEFALRDPDGYYVMVSALSPEVPGQQQDTLVLCTQPCDPIRKSYVRPFHHRREHSCIGQYQVQDVHGRWLRENCLRRQKSAVGHERRFRDDNAMPASPLKSANRQLFRQFAEGPEADVDREVRRASRH